MIQYYFGCAEGVYAKDDSKPDDYARLWSDGHWGFSAATNRSVVYCACSPETPVTIEQILAKYPNFTPLESPTSPEVNQNGAVALTQSGANEPGKLAGGGCRPLPLSLTKGEVGV